VNSGISLDQAGFAPRRIADPHGHPMGGFGVGEGKSNATEGLDRASSTVGQGTDAELEGTQGWSEWPLFLQVSLANPELPSSPASIATIIRAPEAGLHSAIVHASA